MTSFVLKIIALLTMTLDHIGYTFFNHYTWLNIIGKIAFPIFAFQISEGYRHTKNLKNYFLRLFLFAIISEVPFILFVSTFSNEYLSLNIFFTLALGLLTITLFDQSKTKYVKWIYPVITMLIAQFTNCDYGWYGVCIIFLFYYLKEQPKWLYFFFVLVSMIKYLYAYIDTPSLYWLYAFIATSISLVPIHLYSGKQGKHKKYLLYIYYPLHMLILYLIYRFL